MCLIPLILWNYLYLTKLIMEQKNSEKQQEILKIILNGSIVTWRHTNLHGEYDFANINKNDSGFDMEEIRKFQVVRYTKDKKTL